MTQVQLQPCCRACEALCILNEHFCTMLACKTWPVCILLPASSNSMSMLGTWRLEPAVTYCRQHNVHDGPTTLGHGQWPRPSGFGSGDTCRPGLAACCTAQAPGAERIASIGWLARSSQFSRPVRTGCLKLVRFLASALGVSLRLGRAAICISFQPSGHSIHQQQL